MIVLIFLTFVVMALSDFHELIKDKKNFEIKFLAVLYILALSVATLQYFGMQMPSPVKWIRTLILDVWKIGYEL